VAGLTGDIEQVPSAVSAIKDKGERAYHRVRSGEAVELAARPVTVSRFAIRDVPAEEADGIPLLDVDVEVTVSSGTYVRALARDVGDALGCGGHLTALRRTRVGGFGLDVAHPLADLEARQGERMPVTPLALAARAAFVVREVDEAQARTLGYGQRLESEVPGRTEPVAAIAPDGTLVAMLDESRPTARSLVVFAPSSS
jgi:tRNA pseudouridine55 synthase